ncbi:hypothetical protein GA0061098_1002198 [Bradyrhizobium shewense]|uniref:Uncharacterized protein n=1 Tax=Bradyrhizobium shewense TaxID=1761772 RepID=A0A1C3UNI1_9BRAD|nr:hypothetical protein GA0061098_1002198 [Bradyrhizobium shewense]
MGRAKRNPSTLLQRRTMMGFARALPILRPRRHGFAFSRFISPELCSLRCPSCSERAQGRPDAGWHPRSRVRTRRARGGQQVQPGDRPSLREWLYGLCRALPGERCTIAPVALRMTDVQTRLGRNITATLDAQTPGVRTTRFCRPRTSPFLSPMACVRSPSRPNRGRRQRRVVSRVPLLTGIPPCSLPIAPTPSRPPPPGPSRDDRETPLMAGGMGHGYAISEIR